MLGGRDGNLGFLLLAVLGTSVQKNGIRAPAGSNSVWHFFVLPLQTSLSCSGAEYDNQPGLIPCSALVLVVPVSFDIGSVAQDSPQLSATHQPTVEIIKHKMPPRIQVPMQVQVGNVSCTVLSVQGTVFS